MFIDASAILAVHLGDPDGERLAIAMERAPILYVSPIVVYEATLGFAKQKRMPLTVARAFIEQSLEEADCRTVAITAEIGTLALDAFAKFGKGRGHKAQLNMGDCFAYACAKSLGVPLLYKGNDFARTDLA